MMMWGWILIPVLLVLGVFLYNGRNRQNTVKRENPMDILDNRFAKGEISKEEYEEQKRTLNTKN
ncbi:SHOCT domain-containing protein [Bizionia argentinensis JUB59]|uniref:SHOCT domain-containing protein n=2 Tax=Bizionia TaxID=283785 RepID=G2EDV9_9FLAO|nr:MULTISPECIES: SHOCT domain-containing protein [Bizionia]EGV43375.1 SHOCT domain-containing protein [Bizionia argentinensis JUB59]TYB79764.1 SHOCT domain-containing protein [Bizionia myxarmorum]